MKRTIPTAAAVQLEPPAAAAPAADLQPSDINAGQGSRTCKRLRSSHASAAAPRDHDLEEPRPQPRVKAAVADLLRQVFSEEPVQDMDFVELFAWEAAVSYGMRALGYRGWTMDLRISLDHDLLSAAGFLQLLACLARLRPGGVFWAAPPCSTWVFMSRHSTGRDRCVTGNTSSPYVLAQNALVCRLLVALRFCVARGVDFIVEQPHSTVMFEYPPFKQWLASDSAGRVQRIQTQMGAFGMPAVKDTILLGTAPYLGELARRMTPSERDALASSRGRMKTTVKYTDAAGRTRVQGGKDLKATQSYPVRSGMAHALAFQACDRDRKLNAAAARDCASAAAAAEALAPLASAAAAAAAHDTLAPNVPPAAAAAAAEALAPLASVVAAAAAHDTLAPNVPPAAAAAAADDWVDAALRNFDPDVGEDTRYPQDTESWDSIEWHNSYRREQLLKLGAAAPIRS